MNKNAPRSRQKTRAAALVLSLLAAGAIWFVTRGAARDPAGPAVTVRDDHADVAAPGEDPNRSQRRERPDERTAESDSHEAPAAPAATSSMQIRVRRADGLSTAGTHVVAWHDEIVECSGDAGVEGAVELPWSEAARKAVVAAPSHPLVWTEIPAGASVHEVVVPANASVEGVVRVDGLAPRESVEVRLALSDGTPWCASDALPPAVSARLGAGRGLWTSNVPARTDADGRFVFTGLSPGRGVHVVIPQGFVFRDTRAHPYRFVETDVPAQGVFLDLLALPRFTGRVVTSEGTPVVNAVVVLSGTHATGEFASQTKSGADGRFVVCAPFLDPRSLAVTVTDADGRAERRTPIDATSESSRDLGEVRLADVRTVEVRVRDVDGQPVSGAIAVEAHQVVSGAPTDGEGRATLRVWGDPPRVHVGANGFVSAPLDVTTGAAEPIDVVLSRAAVLEVKVNGGPNLRLSTFRLDLSSPGALFDSPRGKYDEIASLTGGASAVAEGSPDGRSASIRLEARDRPQFVVSGLRSAVPVRLRLLDIVGTVHADREISLAAGERRVVVLDVPAPRPFGGTVVDGAGNPVANACVQLSQPDVADDWITVSGPPVLTTRDGRFAFQEIRTGRLRVAVSAAGHPVWTHLALDIPESGRELVVRLEPARRLRVTLRDATGAPVDDAVVHLERTAPGEDGATTSSRSGGTGSEGSWQFDDGPLGAVVVVVKLDSGGESRFTVADAAENVTFTVSRGR